MAAGGNLGKVIRVSNQDGVIVDEHLRVWIEHPVDEPLMRWVKVQPEGGVDEIRYFVKYEKLPFFCLCCGIIGHTSERFCALRRDRRVDIYSTDIRAPRYKQEKRVGGPSTPALGLPI
jgi:hypothetical protein